MGGVALGDADASAWGASTTAHCGAEMAHAAAGHRVQAWVADHGAQNDLGVRVAASAPDLLVGPYRCLFMSRVVCMAAG